jgi:magnesium chelatase subunit H
MKGRVKSLLLVPAWILLGGAGGGAGVEGLLPSVPLAHRGPLRTRTASTTTAGATAFDDETSTISETTTRSSSTTEEEERGQSGRRNHRHHRVPQIVLVAGFESFNQPLYRDAAVRAMETLEQPFDLHVFSDADIRGPKCLALAAAIHDADAVVVSLIFDYDDVQTLCGLLQQQHHHVVQDGPRLLFECSTQLMEYNRFGRFTMAPPSKNDKPAAAGPPPAVKAVLSLFGSPREEDKLMGYIKLLKVAPDLLKFVPGEKTNDLRNWLLAYRYWQAGGAANVQGMLAVLLRQIAADSTTARTTTSATQERTTSSLSSTATTTTSTMKNKKAPDVATTIELPEVVVTPDLGLLHPLLHNQCNDDNNQIHHQQQQSRSAYWTSPAAYLQWRLDDATYEWARDQRFSLAPRDAPRAAVLLYRKHVITGLRYIHDLIRQMEQDGILPIPIFINGVEAHTIVRDLLTSSSRQDHDMDQTDNDNDTFQPDRAVSVDAIVNTIGFPLVGGPAGSMRAGRDVIVAERLLSHLNVPYIIAAPLLLQTIPQWKKLGVTGLQSVVLYSLPELDGAIDTVVLGGLVQGKSNTVALVPERVRKLNRRVQQWVALRKTPPFQRRLAIALYGFPPVRMISIL